MITTFMITKFKKEVAVVVEFNENLYTVDHIKKCYKQCKSLDDFEELESEWECLNYSEVVTKLFPDEVE